MPEDTKNKWERFVDENEFTKMVKAVRMAEQSLGEVKYHLAEKDKGSKKFARFQTQCHS